MNQYMKYDIITPSFIKAEQYTAKMIIYNSRLNNPNNFGKIR